MEEMTKYERLEGCLLGGAIGDAFGSSYENQLKVQDEQIYYLFGKPEEEKPTWQLTDDTQFTLITCEAILENESISAEIIAEYLLNFYSKGKVKGVGSSTLKALQELKVGGHWSQVGRRGEYAAGNGAAMRIAPLAFIEELDRRTIREISSITHQNDEAYVGALCVVLAIRETLCDSWNGEDNLSELLIAQIPDTRLRDRLIEIQELGPRKSLVEIGQLGSSGYVVDSVPLAIAAASRVRQLGLEKMFKALIEIGGDTDTNCSIAGQVAGALLGKRNIPPTLLQELESLSEYAWINEVLFRFKDKYDGI